MSNPKIQLANGVAWIVRNGVRVPILELDRDVCDCGFNTCDCSITFTDLSDGTIWVYYIFDGVPQLVTQEEFDAMVAAGVFTGDPTPSPGTGSAIYSDFFALMPGDNAATVAVGAAVEFPQNGPTDGTIVRTGPSTFNLPAIGTYKVEWQVSVDEAGQLGLKINAGLLANTVVGRATGTNQIFGSRIITTSLVNSVLSVVNPAGNSTALTITPTAGGTNAVSASLVITRIA